MDFKQRFKALVLALGNMGLIRNQQDLGDKMGYSKATMSSIISGRLPMTATSRERLKQVCPSVNLDWLQTGTGEMFLHRDDHPTSINQHTVIGDNTAHCVDGRFMTVFEEQTKQLTTSMEQVSALIRILELK